MTLSSITPWVGKAALALLIPAFLFAYALPVFAQGQQPNPTGTGQQGVGGSRVIQNPLNGINSISQFIAVLLRALIAIGIPIAIIFIVFAGFKFIAAQGSPSALAEARQNFMYVVIGIAIFIGASALAELIVATLRQVGVNF